MPEQIIVLTTQNTTLATNLCFGLSLLHSPHPVTLFIQPTSKENCYLVIYAHVTIYTHIHIHPNTLSSLLCIYIVFVLLLVIHSRHYFTILLFGVELLHYSALPLLMSILFSSSSTSLVLCTNDENSSVI